MCHYHSDIANPILTHRQRCWHDSDQVAIPDLSIDPLLRPLERGEVGVSFYPGHKRAILPDSSLELLDRTLQAGDICKRRHDDVQSAVVTKTEVAFKVSHAISQRLLDERFTLSDIKEDEDVAIGDFVVYDDWIGQVQNVSETRISRLPKFDKCSSLTMRSYKRRMGSSCVFRRLAPT